MCAVGAGALALVGWIAGIHRLTDWRNDGISMFPNTAMCAVASGVALWLTSSGWRSVALARVLALFVSTVSGLTLFEHVSSIDLDIDTLLFADRGWGQAAAAAPMRMGPPASLAFLLVGIALVLLELG